MHGPTVSPARDLHTAPRQKGTMCRTSSYGLRSCDLHCGAHHEGGVASVVGHRRDATWHRPPRYGRRCTETASSLVSSEGCCASAPLGRQGGGRRRAGTRGRAAGGTRGATRAVEKAVCISSTPAFPIRPAARARRAKTGAAKVRRVFATTALPARSTAATLERASASPGRAPDAVWLLLVLLGITWLRRQCSANAGK